MCRPWSAIHARGRCPRAGERHYCADCGRVQAQRDAACDHRQRIAVTRSQARALRHSGATIRAICKQVGCIYSSSSLLGCGRGRDSRVSRGSRDPFS